MPLAGAAQAWAAGNRCKSLSNHGVIEREAEEVFFIEPLLLSFDAAHSQHEPRHHALDASSDGRLLHITFTLRAQRTLLRVISARDRHRKERQIHARAHEDPAAL